MPVDHQLLRCVGDAGWRPSGWRELYSGTGHVPQRWGIPASHSKQRSQQSASQLHHCEKARRKHERDLSGRYNGLESWLRWGSVSVGSSSVALPAIRQFFLQRYNVHRPPVLQLH